MESVQHSTTPGGRWVLVSPERLESWLAGFAGRHGSTRWDVDSHYVMGTGADGAWAECEVPFPPLRVDSGAPYGGLIAHALSERTVGVLLVRLGGYAAGVFKGDQLLASKVGSRLVHGRTAAGGWSQQRFARRREGQARAAIEAAVEVAGRILLPVIADLDAVVAGGDRRAVHAVLADARLEKLVPLVTGRLLDVPDPKQRILVEAHETALKVRIRVQDPD